MEPRVERLVENTTLSEREAQTYLLCSVPGSDKGFQGFEPPLVQLLVSRLSDKDELLARQTIENYENRAEEKVSKAMNTRLLVQYLGHLPDGFSLHSPHNVDRTVPIRSETMKRLKKRLSRATRGTTHDDVITAAFDESRSVTPIGEFISEYMSARPAVGVVVLTNNREKLAENNRLWVQGIVPSEDAQPNNTSTDPVAGIHQSQAPRYIDQPPILREADAVVVGNEEYTLEWSESISYEPDFMQWVCTDTTLSGPAPERPDIDVEDGVEWLVEWTKMVRKEAKR